MTQQEELLTKILAALNKPRLGFHDSAGIVYVYCNRKHGSNWYSLDSNRDPVAISHSSLTGFIRELKFVKVERRGKEISKLQITVAADQTYLLEAGHDSHFSKGLLSAIATLTPEQILKPITIQSQPGDDENVLFSRVWVGSQLIKSHYDGQTKWREVAKSAIAVVKAANQPVSPESSTAPLP